MKKFLTIFKVEYAQVVKKKSFVIGIILTPLFMLLITLLPAFLAKRDISTPVKYAVIDLDERGIGGQLTKALERYKLDSDTARQAYDLVELYEFEDSERERLDSLRTELDSLVRSKELGQYVVIYPGVEQNDSVLMISKSLNIRTTSRYDNRISDILSGMRLEESNINLPVDSVLQMTRRIDMQRQAPGGKSRDFLTIYFGALIFVMIIFISVISFGQVLMRSVIEEKSSRVMEVLVSSVSPFQLMMGKILGLGAANLTQVGIWVLIGLGLFVFQGALNIDVPETVGEIIFNPVLVIFFILFLLLAYIMYSAMFALIGAVVSTDKEAQNFIFPITMSLMLPVFTLMYIVQEPDSAISTIVSLIPIFTPTMMVARLNIALPDAFTFTNPIILEATIGLLLSAAFTLGLIWITARIFRMGILMYGKRATVPEIMNWIRHK